MPKIAVVQAYESGYKKLAQLATPNKKYYCDKHGYDFISIECEWKDLRQGSWIIPTTLFKLLHSNTDYDWFYWTDVDSLIMNFDIKLETFLEGVEPENNLIASLWNYESNQMYTNLSGDIDVKEGKSSWFIIHTGNFLLRNCDWSRKFLYDLCNDQRFYKRELLYVLGGDEFAFTVYFLANYEIRKHFKFYSSEQFIAFDYDKSNYKRHGDLSGVKQYSKGDFIIHFPFRPIETKIQLMEKYETILP